MLEYSLKKAGVDLDKVKIVTVGFTPMPLLLSKRIDGLGDAITWSEPAMYNTPDQQGGRRQIHLQIFRVLRERRSALLHAWASWLRRDTLTKNPELASRFLACLVEGPELGDQQSGRRGRRLAQALSGDQRERSRSPTSLKSLASRRASRQNEHGLGWQDPAVWAKQEEFMREQGLIPAKVDVTKAVTNDFLSAKVG